MAYCAKPRWPVAWGCSIRNEPGRSLGDDRAKHHVAHAFVHAQRHRRADRLQLGGQTLRAARGVDEIIVNRCGTHDRQALERSPTRS
jgi:hypothetical protein